MPGETAGRPKDLKAFLFNNIDKNFRAERFFYKEFFNDFSGR